jgi:hypothetical protein
MKRCSLSWTAFTLALAVLTASSCLAVFDSMSPFPRADGSRPFLMQQGYSADSIVWYVLFETNSIRLAQTTRIPPEYPQGITFTPLLSNIPDGGAPGHTIGIVTNYAQGPVFENSPLSASYYPAWTVAYLTWRPGTTPVVLKKWADVSAHIAELYYSNVPGGTSIDPNVPWTKADATIVAVGPLGGPWWPGPASGYRMKQVIAPGNYAYTKIIYLPTWKVFVADQITRRTRVAEVVIPDIYDPYATTNPPEEGTLAYRLGANYAPGLVGIPLAATQRFYESVPFSLGPPFTVERPPGQFPILQQLASALSPSNNNGLYSPYMFYYSLKRNTVPFYVTITSQYEITRLAAGLTLTDTTYRLNAPIVYIWP